MRYALFLLAICMSVAVYSQDDVSFEAQAYVALHSTESIETVWRKEWLEKVQQMVKDNGFFSSENAAADDILTNWLSGRRKKFEGDEKLTDGEKVALCFMYRLYLHCGWKFDSKVGDMITKANVAKWIGISTCRTREYIPASGGNDVAVKR